MDLNRLRYFIAVAEAEHFHRAANHLRVAQPALSRQIRLLEEELGVTLLERSGRGVRLTDAGRVFLADAKHVLAELDRARDHVREVAGGRAGTLRVSFIDIASWHGVLPETIRVFRLSDPQVKLLLRPLDSAGQLAALQEGKIDVAFVYGGNVMAGSLVSRRVHSEAFVLALPEAHGLARAPELGLADLRDEPFVWTDRTLHAEFDHSLMSACVAQGLVPRIVQETTSSAHIVSLVAVGIGLGLVPSSTRWRLPAGVVLRPLTDLHLEFHIDIAWSSENKSHTLHRFIELALRAARGEIFAPAT